MTRFALVSAAVLLGLLASCSGESADVGGNSEAPAATTVVEKQVIASGVITAVDGTLAQVNTFTVRLPDGSDTTFVPVDGLLFFHNGPISHLRDHLASGAPVRVEYVMLGDGTRMAVFVGDAG